MNLVKLTSKLFSTLTISLVVLSGCISSKIETQTPIISTTRESLNDNGIHIATATFETFNLPIQENDTRLSLTINLQNDEKKCYSPEESIPIMLWYKNLTISTLKIADYDVIAIHTTGAKAQIFPRIYDKNGREVFTPEHLRNGQYGYIKETKAHSLEPNEIFEVLAESYFFPPIIISKNVIGQSQNIPPPSGNYFLQFRYVNLGDSEYWEGVISSNVIEICIKSK